MRDRDSSLGSHVLSQFAVSPRSFFAPLSSGSTISSPLRHAVFPPPASSRGSRGVETSRPPRIFCVKMCMRTRRHV